MLVCNYQFELLIKSNPVRPVREVIEEQLTRLNLYKEVRGNQGSEPAACSTELRNTHIEFEKPFFY